MKTKLIFLILIFGTLYFQSCDVINQMVTFTKCEFKMQSLTNAQLAGVNVQQKKSFSDLRFMDAANITKSLLGGTLPLSFNLNIEAKNPNASAASMQKMEWLAFIDDIQIATGVVDNHIAIPPGGTATIPVQIKVDLKELLKGKSKNALLNFGLNLADAGNYPTRVKLKIKPTVYINAFPIEYPGYFTLKKEFGSQ